MSKGLKLILATMVLGLTISFSTMNVSAATHECSYSYMGDLMLSTRQVGSHQVTLHNTQTGNYEVCTCYISAQTWANVYKCACGSMSYRNTWTRMMHSRCGN